MNQPHTKVGVAVIISRNDKKILLGKRKGAHGAGTWAPPGGHLEFMENPIDCARRETREETGLELINIQTGPWTNDIFSEENKHYITLFMLANHQSGEPQILEPNKCQEWAWFTWDALPSPLFQPMHNLLR